MKNVTKLMMAAAMVLGSSPAFATLPVSALTYNLNIYAIYTSSDATCTSGMIATFGPVASPKAMNLASSATLGSGPIANPVRCMVVVAQNQNVVSWSAGSYSGSTGANPDSNCNAGGSTSWGLGAVSPYWNSTVKSGLQGVGLTIPSTTAGTSSDIVPIYLSVNSTTSNAFGTTSYQAPLSTADASNGVKLTSPNTATSYKLVIGLSSLMGGAGGGTCATTGVETISFLAQ